MSWAEIKKAINTDFTEPLNYLHYIDNIATFGTQGYAMKSNPAIMKELMANSLLLFLDETARQIAYDNVSDDVLDFMLTNSSKLASQINAYNNNATTYSGTNIEDFFLSNTVAQEDALPTRFGESYFRYVDASYIYNFMTTSNNLADILNLKHETLAFIGGTIDEFVGQYKTGLVPRFQESYMQYVDVKLSSPEGVGLWLNSVFDLQEPSLDSLEDIDAIINSETAMTAITNSETAMTAIANSETAMTAIANSETAMTAVIASSVGRLKIWESDVAINALTNNTTWVLLKTLPQIVVQRGTNNSGDYYSGPYASKAIMVSARSSDALNRGQVRTKRGSAGDDISSHAPSTTFLRRIAAVSNIEISNGGSGTQYGEVQYIMVEA